MGVAAKHKRARAGQLLVENPTMSQAQALIAAGYSKVTASKPGSNGLAAERCIEEAKRAGLVPDSAKIRDKARRALDRKLTRLLDSDKAMDKARCGEVARIVDVAERHHGTGQDESRARQWRDRLQGLEALQRILGAAAPQDVALSQEALEHNEARELPSPSQETENTGDSE